MMFDMINNGQSGNYEFGQGGQDDNPKDVDESGEGFEDELAHQNSQNPSQAKRTGSYTEDEDKLICEAC